MKPDQLLRQALQLQQAGHIDQAVAAYRKLLKAEPADPDANNLHGLLYLQTGRPAEAVATIRMALQSNAADAQAHYNLGIALKQTLALQDSLHHFMESARLEPGNPDAHVAVGNLLNVAGERAQAVEAFERALAIQPGHPIALLNLGNAQREAGDLGAALDNLGRAAAGAPNIAEVQNDLGAALSESGKVTEAIPRFSEAVRIAPKHATAWLNLGIAQEQVGELDAAASSIEKAIAANPRLVDAYFHLAHLYGYVPGDDVIAAMTKLYEENGCPDADKVTLAFAIARVLHKQRQYAQSFGYLREGHALESKRSTFNYDEHRRFVGQLVNELPFNPGEVSPRAGGDDIVFIVGMPRSGTTLTEQILASHPSVFAAGETSGVSAAIRHVERLTGKRYPQAVAHLDEGQVESTVQVLREHLPDACSGSRTIVETTPTNFLHAGLIASLLPSARFIHCCRDPMDTGLSIYQHPLSSAHGYAHDLETLGRYYNDYLKLMDHWRRAMPGRIFEANYESMIADPETSTRNLLEFCGIEYDAACLAFHTTERVVRTPSAGQVRQPLYNDSVGRWKFYETELQALRQALENIG